MMPLFRWIKIAIIMVASASLCSQDIPKILSEEHDYSPLFYKLDLLPEDVELGETGTDKIWNFINLQSPRLYVFDHLDGISSEDPRIDDPTFVVTDPWGHKKYIRTRNGGAFLLAEQWELGEFLDPIVKIYSEPYPIWNVKLALGTTSDTRGNWTISISNDQLRFLGIKGLSEIRITGNETLHEIIDAEGLLYLPRSYHHVKRIFREITPSFKVEQRMGNRWEQVDEVVISKLLPWMLDFRSEYVFVDAENKDVLAEVRLTEEDSVQSVLYKSFEEEGIKRFAPDLTEQFSLYPPTSDGNVRLDFLNFKPGKYSLVIFNIVGKKIWDQDYNVRDNIILREDLSFLPKGTYIYSLIDSQKNKLFTRRFAIINP